MHDFTWAMQRETFVGEWVTCKVTGELIQVPFKWVYCFRRWLGLFGLFVFISIVLATYFLIFYYRYILTSRGLRVCADGSMEGNTGCDEYRCVNSDNGPECNGNNDYVRHLSLYWQIALAACNAVQILVYDSLFAIVSSWITDWENHKTHAAFDNFIVFKLFIFKFVNAFTSLFYLSYLQHDMERTGYNNDEIIDEVGIQLGVLFASSLLLQNFFEIFRSHLMSKIKKFFLCRVKNESEFKLSPAEVEFGLEEYTGTLYDMCELVIHYGYVTMFVVAFPLVPFMALVSAIVEMRIDGYKLVNCCRRPFPYNTPGLGVWVNVLDLFSMLAVLNNVAMCVLLTDWPSRCFHQPIETITTRDRILLILTVSGILCIVVLLVKIYIPDVPIQSTEHLQRQLYVEQILCGGQKLDVEVDDFHMSNLYTSEGLTSTKQCFARYFQKYGTKKLQNLVQPQLSSKNLLRPSRLWGANHNENGLMRIPRWSTLPIKGSTGQYGLNGTSSIEFLESVKKNQHKESLSTLHVPSANVQEMQVMSTSFQMMHNSKSYNFGCNTKNNGGLEFQI